MNSPGQAAAFDVVVIGAGAAGLMTAITARRAAPDCRVALVDGARRPGAKILVSGGSRCNVTNTIVTERDFCGGSPAVVRRVLRAFPASAAAEFFRSLGVSLHEEPGGKLFPRSNRSRDVVEALLTDAARAGVDTRWGHRVTGVVPVATGFRIDSTQGALAARRIVLATGGLSLPKTGSDGWGYEAARSLGHTIVATTPALVPLLLGDTPPAVHRRLSGVSQLVSLEVAAGPAASKAAGGAPARLARVEGRLLWTHFGVSGPAVLDLSRHWLRAGVDGRTPVVTANFLPGNRPEDLERRWLEAIRARPRGRPESLVEGALPASAAQRLTAAVLASVDDADQGGPAIVADLSRTARRALLRGLTAWRLPVQGSRGYNYAEVTAGGVPLSEIDPATLESRRCPGVYLVGEVLDVDGRLGGFNFQWAWSSGVVAGRAVARG